MPVPDRWHDYSALGKVIPGTNLLAFKVPLKECLLENIPEDDQRFTPSALIQRTKSLGVNLGLVIDLTFTKKYYNSLEITRHGLEYKKVYTSGQVVPSDDVYSQFASAVKSLDKEDQVVGVHCTHGVNRTGYLICRYMIEELNFDPQEAIRAFGEARGHEIERSNYIDDLNRRIAGEKTIVKREGNSRQDRSKKEKPRWRHHREDHPGWRSDQSSSSRNIKTDHWSAELDPFGHQATEEQQYEGCHGGRFHHPPEDFAQNYHQPGYQGDRYKWNHRSDYQGQRYNRDRGYEAQGRQRYNDHGRGYESQGRQQYNDRNRGYEGQERQRYNDRNRGYEGQGHQRYNDRNRGGYEGQGRQQYNDRNRGGYEGQGRQRYNDRNRGYEEQGHRQYNNDGRCHEARERQRYNNRDREHEAQGRQRYDNGGREYEGKWKTGNGTRYQGGRKRQDYDTEYGERQSQADFQGQAHMNNHDSLNSS